MHAGTNYIEHCFEIRSSCTWFFDNNNRRYCVESTERAKEILKEMESGGVTSPFTNICIVRSRATSKVESVKMDENNTIQCRVNTMLRSPFFAAAGNFTIGQMVEMASYDKNLSAEEWGEYFERFKSPENGGLVSFDYKQEQGQQ